MKPFLACPAVKVFPDGQPECLDNPPFPIGRMEGCNSCKKHAQGQAKELEGRQARGQIKEEESEEGRNKLQKVSWDSE